MSMIASVDMKSSHWRRLESSSISNDPARALPSEGHLQAIEATEGAVGLLAPPTAARGLERDLHSRKNLGPEAGSPQPLEVLILVWGRDGVHDHPPARDLLDGKGLP